MILDFIETDEQYHNGVALEEYNGKLSLVRAYMAKDGEVRVKWGYPEKNKEPISKSIPWKVELGTEQDAIDILRRLLNQFGATEKEPIDSDGPPF